MFGLLRAVLWRPLPYPDAERIVAIRVDARNVPDTGATPGEVLDLKERSHSFEQVSMIDLADANLEYLGETEHVSAARVSDNLLPLLGAHPILGRLLDSRIDEGKERPLAILISNDLWRRRFSADPTIAGKTVRVDNLDVQVVGVLPPGFRLFLTIDDAEQTDIWFPYRMSATRQFRGIPVVARLKPGVTLAQANAELETLAAQFEREYPEFYSGNKGWQASPFDRGSGSKLRFSARLLHDDMTREARPSLLLLSGAVGFVLLIACVNVANLLLTRGSSRQREFAIRRALGAGRMRIMRQLLTESLILALAAATIGLCSASFGLAAIVRFRGSHIPLQSRVGLDASVPLFAIALAVLTTVLFGVLPAWRLATGTTNHPLSAGRSETAASGARRLQRTLVIAEVALSIVPLACGGLMLRSFLNLLNSPLGFVPSNLVTATVPVNAQIHPHAEQQWAWLRDVLDHVRALPGVESVSAASPLPLAGQETRRVGRADRPDALPIQASQQFALPGYLRVMGTPLLEGHDFTDDDVATQRPVTIIDEHLAKHLWPEGAIGKQLVVFRTGHQHVLEVIGVTAAVRVTAVRDQDAPHFILPYSDYPRQMSLVIRTGNPAASLVAGIKQAVDAAHGGRAVYDVVPMSDYVSDSIGDTRFVLFVLAAFATASALLASVGLYGTLAYLTAQRKREFGIRLALGSSVRAIVAIVMRESVLLAGAGVVLGLFGAAAVTRGLENLLYGVGPLDSLTLFGVIALVAIVALAAAVLPAWRAANIDPQTSLRSE